MNVDELKRWAEKIIRDLSKHGVSPEDASRKLGYFYDVFGEEEEHLSVESRRMLALLYGRAVTLYSDLERLDDRGRVWASEVIAYLKKRWSVDSFECTP